MSQVSQEQPEEHLVVFRLADGYFGLDIGVVQEIILWQAVTRVPLAPECVEGIISLRGSVIPVIDLRRRCGLKPAEPGRETRTIVVRIGALVAGLVVDGVSEVLRVPGNRITPPPAVISDLTTELIRGVASTDGRLIILLDADRILEQQQLHALATGADTPWSA